MLNLAAEDWKTLLMQLDTLETKMFPNDRSGLAKVVIRKSQIQIEQGIYWNGSDPVITN